MNDANVLDLIRDALTSVAPRREAEFANLRLDQTIEGLGLDSITTMEMVGAIEDRISATFADEDLARVSTLGDLAQLIRANS